VPLLIHVADPEEFWDREKVPEWAYNNGWFWGDGTYTAKEDLYREVDGFMMKFPKIHGIFAHFYFLSADLEKAAAFLDKWENVSIDLTPGTEMFVNLSKNPEKARGFFLKYQDRILFGTDNYDPGNEEELDIMTKIVRIMRQFMETDDEFQVWDLTFKGIKLEREVLEKIYYKNFFKYVKPEPKKLNLEAAVKESKLTIELAKKASVKESKMEEMNELLNLLDQAAKGEA
jgi:predicted TIM-barrel fold metal-dependent hydrolase